MVIDAIRGRSSNHKALNHAAADVFGTSTLHDDEYLKLLSSGALTRRLGKDVGAVSFMGADLRTLAELSTKIRTKLPDKQVYCIVSLLSELHTDDTVLHPPSSVGVWHSNVILWANGESVVVHDPSAIRGGAQREIPKDVFMKRWAQAYLRGHLIVA
jgi:hypothetical protein